MKSKGTSATCTYVYFYFWLFTASLSERRVGATSACITRDILHERPGRSSGFRCQNGRFLRTREVHFPQVFLSTHWVDGGGGEGRGPDGSAHATTCGGCTCIALLLVAAVCMLLALGRGYWWYGRTKGGVGMGVEWKESCLGGCDPSPSAHPTLLNKARV